MRLSTLPLGVALLFAGCSGGSSSSSSSSSSSGGSVSGVAALFTRLSKAGCDQEDRCAASNGRIYADLATCKAAADVFYDGAAFEDAYGSLYNLDTTKVDTCVADYAAALAARACDAIGGDPMPDSCKAALNPRDPVAVGGVCQTPGTNGASRSCGWGSVCTVSTTGCGVCQVFTPVGLGGSCAASPNDCAAGLYCVSSSGTCQAQLGIGSACTGSECRGNLSCEGLQGARTCKARVGAGQPCDNAWCFSGLACAGADGSKTCVPYLADGASCSRAAGTAGCNGYCAFASANAATGTCAAWPAPGAGQPCGWRSYGASGSSTCDYGTAYPEETLNGNDVTACTCRAVHATGSCTDASECTISCDGRDYTMTPPGPGMCAVPATNGTQCHTDTQCTSGYCDRTPSPSVCAPPPACP